MYKVLLYYKAILSFKYGQIKLYNMKFGLIPGR